MGDAAEMPNHLEMAKELDEMDRDVASWEASFLEETLKTLKKGDKLTPKDEAKLEIMYRKYLGEKEGDPDVEPDVEDGDAGEEEEFD